MVSGRVAYAAQQVPSPPLALAPARPHPCPPTSDTQLTLADTAVGSAARVFLSLSRSVCRTLSGPMTGVAPVGFGVLSCGGERMRETLHWERCLCLGACAGFWLG
eukprot:2113956-Rhodomonas_salina.1